MLGIIFLQRASVPGSRLRFEGTRWHQCSALVQCCKKLRALIALYIQSQIDTHRNWFLMAVKSPEVLSSSVSRWPQLKWCVWLHAGRSLMWHYLHGCLRNGSGVVWVTAQAHTWMHNTLALSHTHSHTQRNYRFKSHWFPGPLRKAAVIMAEVNISLKCHWKKSADKKELLSLSWKKKKSCRLSARQLRSCSNRRDCETTRRTE